VLNTAVFTAVLQVLTVVCIRWSLKMYLAVAVAQRYCNKICYYSQF